ncbi:MAG: cmk [Acidimicrobiia bacterium]|nr:cmk [Acidimicrobiia bacterium]
MTDLIVTLDGPAGTGKSTVSRKVASRLGVPRLDTGAFYRAAGLAAIRAGVDLADHEAVANVVAGISLDQDEGRMLLDGLDVSEEIRGPESTEASSRVSTHPEVRGLLVVYQRDWVARHDNRAVVEGRDIGSVVLDARPEIRAQRRADQTGKEHAGVLDELRARDERDSTRRASPLIIPEGAEVIDTSDMTVDEVVDRIVELAREAAV